MPDLAFNQLFDFLSDLLFSPVALWLFFGGGLALVLAGTQQLRPASARTNHDLAARLA